MKEVTVVTGKGDKWKSRLRVMLMAGMMVMVFACPAFAASESVDISATLSSSFQTMADTMVKTILAALPAIMSIMSVYVCINFGIRFFRKFAK